MCVRRHLCVTSYVPQMSYAAQMHDTGNVAGLPCTRYSWVVSHICVTSYLARILSTGWRRLIGCLCVTSYVAQYMCAELCGIHICVTTYMCDEWCGTNELCGTNAWHLNPSCVAQIDPQHFKCHAFVPHASLCHRYERVVWRKCITLEMLRVWGLKFSVYGVATTSRLLKIVGLFCKRDL